MNPVRHAVRYDSPDALAGTGSGSPIPVSTALSARLSGAAVVPPVPNDATGRLAASLATGTHVLCWQITYSGLSGPARGARFRGPAVAGQNAATTVPIGAPWASPVTGCATLTRRQAADLAAGRWYVSLETAAHPDGEARGQVGVIR